VREALVNASSFDHILKKVVIVPVIALLAGAAILVWQIRESTKTVNVIETCDRRIALTLTIEKLVLDQETGLRGYEITHDPRLLQRYFDAQAELPGAFDRREALVRIAPRRSELTGIRNAYETWQQAFARPLIATIQAGGSTNDVNLNLRGKLMMDDFRERIANLNQVTEKFRDDSVTRWHRQILNMMVALLGAALLLGLVLGFYTRRLIQQVSTAFRQSHDALRFRAEQTFRSEEKLRTTLRSIGDGVITCDTEGRVLTLNDTAQELTGWTEREAREQPLAEVFPIFDEQTGQPRADPVARIVRSNQLLRLENHTLLRRRDGCELFIEESGAPIRDKQGQPDGVVIVFRDVTMARKSQQALLANEKLAVAGRLAASIAHEIHNPLDSVSNLLFLMDGVADDGERDHFLALAKQEIARVTQISRAMLSLYRESRAPVLIDLREMIESILLLMDSRFNTLRVHISHDIPNDLCVRGFPAELRQVFTNLLTNAAEATGPDGTIHIAGRFVTAGPDDDGARREQGAMITIEDNGPGIPENILHQLFQPFFTTKGERGTGLGLWISRGIITKHGGTIELTSSTGEADHGTTVSVLLAVDPVIDVAAA
jgi:PAS domain S-box-containing protein